MANHAALLLFKQEIMGIDSHFLDFVRTYLPDRAESVVAGVVSVMADQYFRRAPGKLSGTISVSYLHR